LDANPGADTEAIEESELRAFVGRALAVSDGF